MKKIKTSIIAFAVLMTTMMACNNVENKKDETSDISEEIVQDYTHACSMHPEVKGMEGYKCTKCGMDLQPIKKDEINALKVDISSKQEVLESGKPVNFSISITDNGKNVPLEVQHDMKMHLLVVNEELTWFDHIHPEEQTDSTYNVSETFPFAGKYLMFTDFKAVGLSGTVDKQEIEVKGTPGNQVAKLDPKYVSKVDGYTVSLLNGEDLKTNRSQDLKFAIEKKGKKFQVADMQDYLGATAHIVMISQIDKDFLHIHPMSDKQYPIYAQTNINKPGVYRMWVQFKIDGKLQTADFTVDVSEGEKTSEAHSGHDHH